MAKRIKKIEGGVGLSPGSFFHIPTPAEKSTKISVLQYDSKSFNFKEEATIEECLSQVRPSFVTWIQVQGLGDTEAIEKIGRMFRFHPLMVEDIVNTHQRSKIDDYKKELFIVTGLFKYNPRKKEVEEEQVSFVLGENFVISFVDSKKDIFDPIRDRLKKEISRIRNKGADYLCYALIDCVVDEYFFILEKIDKKLDEIEDELFDRPTPETLHKIQRTKRNITLLRKSVWPMREVLLNLRKSDSPLIDEYTKLFVQDVYDHTIRTVDTIESFREITAGLVDIYITTLNQRMNKTMQVLTVVATIFVPLTFIASLYGMNFRHMPELDSRWGYPIVLLIMAIIGTSMFTYFRKKNWV